MNCFEWHWNFCKYGWGSCALHVNIHIYIYIYFCSFDGCLSKLQSHSDTHNRDYVQTDCIREFLGGPQGTAGFLGKYWKDIMGGPPEGLDNFVLINSHKNGLWIISGPF